MGHKKNDIQCMCKQVFIVHSAGKMLLPSKSRVCVSSPKCQIQRVPEWATLVLLSLHAVIVARGHLSRG